MNGLRASSIVTGACFALAVGCSVAPPPPATCQEPRIVTGNDASFVVTVDTADDHFFHCGYTTGTRPSYIIEWKAFSRGTATFEAHGEGALVDTILEVLDSDCFTPLACNDDFGGVASRVVMNVEADHVYLLAVGTFSPLRRAVEVHVAIAVAPDASIDAGVSTDNGADASRDANAWDTARAPRDPDETPRDGAAVVDAQEHDGGATLTCMGNPGYGCPPSLTCADGAG